MVKRLEPYTGQSKLQGRTIRSRVHKCHCLPRVLLFSGRIPIMPNKVVETPYPLIDADPHASRVVRYFRPSDYAAWAGATAAFPAALYAWGMKFSQLCRLPPFLTKPTEMADPTRFRMKTTLKLGGFLGFTAGFLLAYQRSSRACILQQLSYNPYFPQCGSGAGRKIREKKTRIWKNLANVLERVNLCTANPLNQNGSRQPLPETLNGLSLNSVRYVQFFRFYAIADMIPSALFPM